MKRILGLIMVIMITLSMITTVTAGTFVESDHVTENIDAIATEEKIISQININDDFRDDEIIVVFRIPKAER